MNNTPNEPANQNSKNLPLSAQILFLTVILFSDLISAVLFDRLLTTGNGLDAVGLLLPVIGAALTVIFALTCEKTAFRILLFVAQIPAALAALAFVTLPFSVITAFLPLALSLPIFLVTRLGQRRTLAIASGALVTSLLFILLIAFVIGNVYGKFDLATVRKALSDFYEPIAGEMKKIYQSSTSSGEIPPSMLELIDETVKTFRICTVGMIGVGSILLAYFVTLLARLIARVFDRRDLFPVGVRIFVFRKMTPEGITVEKTQQTVDWPMDMSEISAYVFIGIYLLTLIGNFVGGSFQTVAIAFENVSLLMSPFFLYLGFRSFWIKIRTGGCLLLFLPVVLAMLNPVFLYYVFLVIGLLSVILRKRHTLTNRPTDDNSGKE